MYYLLKLESYVIEVGTKVTDNKPDTTDKLFFVTEHERTISPNHTGLFWNGKKLFSKIGSEYDNVITENVYSIFYSTIADGDVDDELDDAIEDLLEDDLISQWENLDEPIVFLMVINDYRTWTDCGYEYDVEHYSVKVITDADFAKMV